MAKDTDDLIREMHSGIAVVQSEIKTLRRGRFDDTKKLEHIKELVTKQNGRVKRNEEEIEQHAEEHLRKESSDMWRIGMVVSVVTFIVSIGVRFVFP